MIATTRLRQLLELALIAFLAVQAGRLVWIFAEPASTAASQPAKATAPAPDLAVLERFNPFGATAAPVVAELGPAAPGLILYGVRTGSGGTAIMGAPGGTQKVYRVGEEISPGVVLRAIAADHVMLAKGGVSTRLALARQPGGAATPPGSYTSGPRAP